MPRKRTVNRTIRVVVLDVLFVPDCGEGTYHKECSLTSAEKKNNAQLLKMVEKAYADEPGRPVRVCSKRLVLRSYCVDEEWFVAHAEFMGEKEFDPLSERRGRRRATGD